MKIKRAPHRALHAIDIENEIKSGSFGIPDVERLHRTWAATTNPAVGDLYYFATGTRTAEAVAFGWPNSRPTIASGKDGADNAIIEQLSNVEYIKARFDHVYLGTGDHSMQPVVKALIDAGVKVTLVGHKFHIHNVFYTTKGLEIKYLDDEWALAA